MDKQNFTSKGNAQFGLMQVKNRLATLRANQKQLSLESYFYGPYQFEASDVIRIEPKRLFFVDGIKIVHTKSQYPKRIIFFPRDSDQIAEDIRRTGFVPSADPGSKPGGKVLTGADMAMLFVLAFAIGVFLSSR